MAKKTIRDIDVQGKRCLVRVDFNVPLEEEGGAMVVTDDTRINGALPTIQYLLDHGAKVILCSHLGRPKGKRDPKQSLRPAAERLEKLLKRPVLFIEECVGAEAEKKAHALKEGEVLVLENLRFHAEEEKNDAGFAKSLAALGEVYINDAFGSAHRAHASTEAIAHILPDAVSGLLMEKELKFLVEELRAPKRPFIVILGGAKVSDKIQVIDTLLDKADTILIGGAMAYTFALAQGKKIGNSLSEPNHVDTALKALEKAKAKGVAFLLPVDNAIAEKIDFGGRKVSPLKIIKSEDGIPKGWEGVDIGPETVKIYSKEIAAASTILWNGPMGIFEIADCAKGTFAIAEAVANNSASTSIIGGGDSVKAVKKAGYGEKVTFISTGGGASLELLEGKTLPGVAVLQDKK
ncbi:MAG: phosphoglycerate kinase [Chthoniobacterales bacterium]